MPEISNRPPEITVPDGLLPERELLPFHERFDWVPFQVTSTINTATNKKNSASNSGFWVGLLFGVFFAVIAILGARARTRLR